jgi:hypothetical protein
VYDTKACPASCLLCIVYYMYEKGSAVEDANRIVRRISVLWEAVENRKLRLRSSQSFFVSDT